MTGTVTKIDWSNPHIPFPLDVTDDNGNVVYYAVEGGHAEQPLSAAMEEGCLAAWRRRHDR